MEAQSSQPCPSDPNTPPHFNLCHHCKQDSSAKSPKLFTCLHNYCSDCIPNLKTTPTCKYICEVCSQETSPGDVKENKFLTELRARSEASEKTNNSDHICQGCEEHASATSFCADCSDWLCDACVFAHRRVKVTKDHTIQPKNAVAEQLNQKDKIELCPTHPREQLKLFCASCNALTCRDCQLNEHQKHDFKPVSQASNDYKTMLVSMIDKLTTQVTALEQADSFIASKIEEINQKERTETEKIQKFAIIFITEINRRGRDMVQDLKELCASRRNDLLMKQINLSKVLERYKHTIQFTDEIINSASSASLLQTRSVVENQIVSLRQAKISMPNPAYKFDVLFGFNPNLVRDLIPKLGQLNYNGNVYSGDHTRRRLQEKALQPPISGGMGPRVSTSGTWNPRPPVPGPVSGSSGVISSSTGGPLGNTLTPKRSVSMMEQNTSPTGSNSGEQARQPDSSETSSNTTASATAPTPEVRVKKEKIDESYEATNSSQPSTSNANPNPTPPSSEPAADTPTIERFGTVLSIPELGLEAESRTVYIPASAPVPQPGTPRRTDSQDDDPNEDWCAVCHNGGELLCCEYCPKVFHTKCHVPEITEAPEGAWKCGLCVEDSELKIETEPSRVVMINGERKRKVSMGLVPQEIKTCERILLELYCHQNSLVFHNPVPKTEPGYYQIIKNPMDFQTIRSKLRPKHFNHYKSVQEFIDDICLVFANCKLYNAVGSLVRDYAVVVESYFMDTLQRLCPFIAFEAAPQEAETPSGEPANKRQCTEAGDA